MSESRKSFVLRCIIILPQFLLEAGGLLLNQFFLKKYAKRVKLVGLTSILCHVKRSCVMAHTFVFLCWPSRSKNVYL